MSNFNLDPPSVDLNQLEKAFREVEDSYDTSKSVLNWFGHKYLVIDRNGSVGTTRFGFFATNFDTIVGLIKKSVGDFPQDKSSLLAKGLSNLRERYLHQRSDSWGLKHIFRGIFSPVSNENTAMEARKIIVLEQLRELGFKWSDPKKIEQNFGSLLHRNPTEEFLPKGWRREVVAWNEHSNPSHIEIYDDSGARRVSVNQGRTEAFIYVEIANQSDKQKSD